MNNTFFVGGVIMYNDKVKNKFNNDDYFDGKEYVEKIKDAVKTDDIKSIGVYGKWGIGKTSIIKNAISELIEEGEYKENQIVEYNAWKYNEYDFMRDFLIVCSNKIEGKNIAKEREESYYSDSSEDRQLYVMLWKKFLTFLEKSWKVLLFILIAYIFSVIIILQVNKVHPTWYDCADLLTPLTLTIISFILPLFLVSEITHKSVSKKFSPEQFARDFEDIVKDKKILIFIDDYFNCLTVGSVMRPVTDSHKVSRAKLSYLIDATAAPICIIAPISSWAAAVSGFVEGEDGFSIFVRAIPYNYYALFTIAMMILITVWNFDYGPMAKYETNALKGDLFSDSKEEKDTQRTFENPNGRVLDLILPVLVLIVCCVLGMLYSGGFFSGVDFVSAFAGSDASVGLALGSIFALLLTILYYCLRRIMSFRECCDCLPYGFKAMVPAILILTFAWTLKAMTDSLGAADFVAGTISQAAGNLMALLPAIIFLIGAFLAFATGTSWGTFGILIPIVVAVFQTTDPQLMIISISACMAGAVCGDHCSPRCTV